MGSLFGPVNSASTNQVDGSESIDLNQWGGGGANIYVGVVSNVQHVFHIIVLMYTGTLHKLSSVL